VLLSSQSDERLVSLARAGHERAFAVIVERYRSELHAMARRWCSDGRSEDVVQQAFLSAFAALRSGSEVRHLRGWLYQIVRNAAARPQAPLSVPLDRDTASAHTVEDVVQQRALARTALSELARLPARQRQAMIGTALDGRARAEIADSMGLSEGAVRQLVHRARVTLRSAVTALTPWPLARWVAVVGPDAPGPAELAAGAGAVTSGGLALKLGALLASATFLTGAAIQLHGASPHRSRPRPATLVHRQLSVAGADSPGLVRAASVVPQSPRPQGGHASVGRRERGDRPGASLVARRPERHDAARGRSGGRGDGEPVHRHDDGGEQSATEGGERHGTPGGASQGTPGGSGKGTSGGGGRDDDGAAALQNSGSDSRGGDGGHGSGGHGGGSSGSGDGASTVLGSQPGDAVVTPSASHPLDSAIEGSSSDRGAVSGDGSESGSGGGSGDGDGTSGH
jgi:RNA polymerase sigma factor (sigma-70 family)